MEAREVRILRRLGFPNPYRAAAAAQTKNKKGRGQQP
jgi:hypothetical protein